MNITVRINGPLARTVGQSRLYVTSDADATIGDLISQLQQEYPEASRQFGIAVPVISGRHSSPETVLEPGVELSLLMPVAGGR